MNIINRIRNTGVVAVVRLDDLSCSVELARALVAGGVDVIEFTLTNPDAVGAIATTRDTLGDSAVIGAGSVVTAEQVRAVSAAGAAFAVSPVTEPSMIDACHASDLPVMPGAYTPSEIQTAWSLDVACVKVFPARGLGPAYIKDVLAPLPHLKLMPTGGISAANAADYIRAGVVAVGAGGSLLDRDAIAAGDWNTIRERAATLKAAVERGRS